MSDPRKKTSGNGMAVGISVAVAGLFGTIAASLLGRNGKASKKAQAQAQIEERLERLEAGATQSVDQLVHALEGIRIQGRGESHKAGKQARKIGKSASRAAETALKSTKARVAELDRAALQLQVIERANHLGHEGSGRASDLAKTLSDRTSIILAEAKSTAPDLKQKATQTMSDAAIRGSEYATLAKAKAPEVRHALTKAKSDMAAKGSQMATQTAERAPEAFDKASKAISDATSQGGAYASQMLARGPDLREKAAKVAHDVSEHAREIVPDVRNRASGVTSGPAERVSSLAAHVPGVVEAVSAHVASAVHNAQAQAKPRLNDASAVRSNVVDQVVSSAREAGKRASDSLIQPAHHSADVVAGTISAQRQHAAATLSSLGNTATERLTQTTGAIEHKSKSAASAAGRGTKDAGALVMWSSAAAGVVYYAFLKEGQRAKVKQSARRIVAEVKEVINDIRGYDEEFR